jgi:plastocyanin
VPGGGIGATSVKLDIVKKILVTFAAVLALALSPVHGATSVTVVTAVGLEFLPGSPHYPVPLLVGQGTTLQFANLDPLGWHAVESTLYDEDGAPIFSSRSVGMGMTATVNGVELLAPGEYAFMCTIHFGMNGNLTIVG